MRFSERRVPMTGWAVLLWAVVSVLTACPNDQKQTGGVGTTANEVRSALLAETTNYHFGRTRTSTHVDTSLTVASPPPLPTVTISTATRVDTAGRPHSNRFIQRLHSSIAYGQLGLAPGDNYIWRDSTNASAGGPWRILVVPRDTTYPMVWLKTDSSRARPLIDSADDAPFMMAANGGFQCDAGCTPHCNAFEARASFEFSRDGSSIKIRR